MKKIANVLLYTFIGISAVWALFLALGAFGVLPVNHFAGSSFNYVLGLIVVVIGLVFYILFSFVEKIKGLIVPDWFKILFYTAFFAFTNVYCYFSLFHTIVGIIIFVVYFAVLMNILSVSIFYNSQKDDNNNVKTTNKFLVFSCFGYSAVFGIIYEMISILVKIVAKENTIINSVEMILIEIGTFMIVSIIFAIMFAVSLKRTKIFINSCLIKLNNVTEYKAKK